ncbi:MAG: DNA-binding domain-containing protein [Steroidobacteraceae bacterium]
MPSLREMQLRFAGALFAEVESQAFGLLAGDPLAAAAGVAVYRNNLREGFRKALALEFPVVEQLVGGDYFRQLAREFLAAHPSRSGDLYGIGAPFPVWLRERFAATEYAWFADVAALEWALEELRIAPAPAAATALDLAAVDPDRHADLRLLTAPCRAAGDRERACRRHLASAPAADDARLDRSRRRRRAHAGARHAGWASSSIGSASASIACSRRWHAVARSERPSNARWTLNPVWTSHAPCAACSRPGPSSSQRSDPPWTASSI